MIVGSGLAAPPTNAPPEVLFNVIEKLKPAFTVRLNVMLRMMPLTDVPMIVMVCMPTGVSLGPPANTVRKSAVTLGEHVGKQALNENDVDTPDPEVE